MLGPGRPEKPADSYTAKDIEVLEGLEPVRRRPGMYIGGTDERALHHLVAEVLDNAMDEAVAGHANRIELELDADIWVTVRDNGRGMPVDPHPKFPGKSALEVILTTLHSGGKFGSKAYQTSGGLHGVGVSVVNALSERLAVEVARNRQLWRQHYSRGHADRAAAGGAGAQPARHDGELSSRPGDLRRAALPPGAAATGWRARRLSVPRRRDPLALRPRPAAARTTCRHEETFHFPGGLADYLARARAVRRREPFGGRRPLRRRGALGADGRGVEWAVDWPSDEDDGSASYCNTIPTPEGGTHEPGCAALLKGIRAYGELIGNRRSAQATRGCRPAARHALSLFTREPQFQGQTKDRLATHEAARLVENAVRDRFDHWLGGDPATGAAMLDYLADAPRSGAAPRAEKEIAARPRRGSCGCRASSPTARATRATAPRCSSSRATRRAARRSRRETARPRRSCHCAARSSTSPARRPTRCAATRSSPISCRRWGAAPASSYREDLRYEKIVIMTDADVDGAHIASLLMTFFFREMPKLIEHGHLYLAQPPLYRLTQGGVGLRARRRDERNCSRRAQRAGKVEPAASRGWAR